MDNHYNNLNKKLDRLLNEQQREKTEPTTTIHETTNITSSIPGP
jgi:hypothetical protein